MAFRDFLNLLRRGWITMLVLALLGGAAATAYTFRLTPSYQASSKVFVSPQSARSLTELNQGNDFTQQVVQSYASIVATPVVLEPVITKLNLNMSASSLARQISGSAALSSTVIVITASDRSPDRAAALANAVAASFTKVVATLSPETVVGIKTTDVSNAIKVTLLQSASVPSSPSSPNRTLNQALGIIIGIIIGLAATAIRNRLDTRVRGIGDLSSAGFPPILGGISKEQRKSASDLVVRDEPQSPRAEAFRSLRTNLQFLDYGGRPHSFVFTSATEGEGKTTIVSNLAIAIANSGVNVVVVDADLRKPRLAEVLGLEGSVGLTDVLIGKLSLNEALQEWGDSKLKVLSAGRIPPNPSELLGSQPMAEILSQLTEIFDLVLVDAPPLLPVTDAAILTRRTGGAILVVASGLVQQNQVAGALEVLRSIGAEAVGLVANRLPTKGPYADTTYGYGYGYTYGARQKK